MAAYNLFDLTYRVARELGFVWEGVASAGSVATTVDTYAGMYPDDWFNYGTLWLLYDAGGASAAPEGEWARVTDFTQSSGTIAHDTLSAAVAAGDRYAVAPRKWSREIMVQQINLALQEILIPYEDFATITTADSQLEYALPAAILDERIEVYIQTNLNDTDMYGWLQVHDWYIRETGTGSQKLLCFRNQPISGRLLRLVYYLPHPALNARTDKMREGVSLERVVLGAAVRCTQWLQSVPGTVDPDLPRRLSELQSRLEMHKIASKRLDIKLNTLGAIDTLLY